MIPTADPRPPRAIRNLHSMPQSEERRMSGCNCTASLIVRMNLLECYYKDEREDQWGLTRCARGAAYFLT